MTYYFLETILIKIANSAYKDNFIFKSGFLLSNVIGIQSRTTVDIDFLIRNYTLSEENIVTILKDCLTEDDLIAYEIVGVEDIKKKDIYGGGLG